MSPLGAGLLWLFISSITIEITTYLFFRELEVDLSRSDVDDRVDGVEECSSKDDRYVFFSHVQNHEVGRGIVIMYSYHYVFCYSIRKSN
jgi:hypothetical protein